MDHFCELFDLLSELSGLLGCKCEVWVQYSQFAEVPLLWINLGFTNRCIGTLDGTITHLRQIAEVRRRDKASQAEIAAWWRK